NSWHNFKDAAVPQCWIAAGATMIEIAVGLLLASSLIAQAEPLPQPKVGHYPGGSDAETTFDFHRSQSVAYVRKYCAGSENGCSAALIGYFRKNARDAVRGAAGKFELRRRSF
ncbi:MAG TPA: hypothetical protein VFP79_14560, partial [Pseudolabrys sp.]|nr:hypothetical protein [Pseudolabrys sp.]